METTPIAIVDPNKPSPSPSPSGKVCTVSFLSTLNDYYAILIVDLASSPLDVDGGGGYISTAPTFLLDRTHLNNEYYAFCVLDSTLFIFQIGHPGVVFGPREGKSVYSVDLNPSEFKFISAEIPVLDKSMIKPLPDLLWPKYDPIEFELYDPLNYKERRSLPSPKPYLPPYQMWVNEIYRRRLVIFLTNTPTCSIKTTPLYSPKLLLLMISNTEVGFSLRIISCTEKMERFDLDKFRSDVRKLGGDALLEISVVKTFKFVFDGYHCSDLIPGYCFPIVT